MSEIPDSPESSGRSESQDLSPQDERSWARKRIEKKRGLQSGSFAYVVVNAFLIGAWAMTGRGYFWPGWVIAGWGMGMVLGWWDYARGPVTEAEIDRELRRK